MEELPSDLERVIVSEQEIQDRVLEIAAEITNDYAGVNNLYLVGILKGAFIFMADLARHLDIPHAVDFMALSSYGKGASPIGEVRLLMDLREPITDKHVLLVEDIVDSGRTLNYLQKILNGRQPASLRTCVLVQKKREQIKHSVHYVGFTIPDVWVVGYGLDFADRYRTLPYIAELKREAYA